MKILGSQEHVLTQGPGFAPSMDASFHIWQNAIILMTPQWAQWRLKSPALQLFTEPFIRAQVKENNSAPRHWPLCGEFTDDRWIPRTKAQ